MLGRCSWHHQFAVCLSGANLSRNSSFWRWVGICVFPCRTGTSRSCSQSEDCTPITSRCGGGSNVTRRKLSADCARGSDRPTTVGGQTRPTSGSRASGCIYTGLSTPAVRRSTSFCRLTSHRAAQSRGLWRRIARITGVFVGVDYARRRGGSLRARLWRESAQPLLRRVLASTGAVP
jgi:hypothetical protein